MNYLEIMTNNLKKSLLELGVVSQRLIPTGERSGLAGAHRADGKRFVVRAERIIERVLGARSDDSRCQSVNQNESSHLPGGCLVAWVDHLLLDLSGFIPLITEPQRSCSILQEPVPGSAT